MLASPLLDRVELAGPGFLNFHLSHAWLHDVVRRASAEAPRFGHSEVGRGQKVNVEYVSANPTGPINVVSGRHAAVGDAISALLEACGYEVTREFYVNDAGRQMSLFASSLEARYLSHLGRDTAVPEDGYQGEYVAVMASELAGEVGASYADLPDDERRDAILGWSLAHVLAAMKASLERFGTRFDVWFSERTLHDRGKLKDALDRLGSGGFTYEKDEALWFRSSDLGDDKDRVLLKASGEPTYLAADAPYLADKFSRGHDRLLYLWGADHHGTVARLLAAAEALGFERDRVEVRLVQIVTLIRGGDAVKASKRLGVLVPLDELVDEVGKDAARYTFLTRSMESPLEFDIELAKVEAPENPVYYVQYAHARICSIQRKASDEGVAKGAEVDLSQLTEPAELALMRKLASYEEVIPEAAEMRAPQRVTRYLGELASSFSAFYRDAKVITDDASLTTARLQLCDAVRFVLADGLKILGVDAPERM
jgi:arginyl-tRNA synthetase